MNAFRPSPEPVRWRRGVYAAALVIPFTGLQLWAALVLLRMVSLSGVVGQAFLLALSGSLIAVGTGWRWAWRLGTDPGR